MRFPIQSCFIFLGGNMSSIVCMTESNSTLCCCLLLVLLLAEVSLPVCSGVSGAVGGGGTWWWTLSPAVQRRVQREGAAEGEAAAADEAEGRSLSACRIQGGEIHSVLVLQ